MQTIYLSNEDTVDIIAGKIKNSQEKEINLLVLSRTIPVLSVVNLKMFKKIAENLNKIVSVSTADEAVKILVENSGIQLRAAEKKNIITEAEVKRKVNTDSFVGNARLIDSISLGEGVLDLSSHREIPQKQTQEFLEEPMPFKTEKRFTEFNETEDDKEADEVEKEMVKFQVPRTSRNIFIGFIIMVIIAVGVAGYVLLPTAKIIIIPKANPVNTSFDLIIDKNINKLNIAEKKIPATIIVADIEKDGQFTATGKKQLNSKATGTVTFYNEWSSYPQRLVEGTRLSTVDDKIYKTTKSIVIPGFVRDETSSDVPGKIDVSIVAFESGPEYNIDPADFTILGFKGTAKYIKIYAKSATATSGGALGFTTVVSADDFKKAKDFLQEEAEKNIVSQLNDKKPSDLIMVEQAMSIKSGELISSFDIDQPSNKFTASLKISAIAFLFNENDVKEISKSILEEENEEKKNFVIIDTGTEYGTALILGLDAIKLSVMTHANVFNLVNESDMRAKIIGKNKEELEGYVKNNYPDMNKVSVTLWPFWVTKIPSIEKNVSIILDIPHGE